MSNFLKITKEQIKEIEKLKSLNMLKPQNIVAILEENIYHLLNDKYTKKQIAKLIENEIMIKVNYPHFSNIIKKLVNEKKQRLALKKEIEEEIKSDNKDNNNEDETPINDDKDDTVADKDKVLLKSNKNDLTNNKALDMFSNISDYE